MFNLAKGIFKSARNQNQPFNAGASGSNSSIQPPHVSSELLETQLNREVAGVNAPKKTHEKELNQWVMQVPIWERDDRQKVAHKILSNVKGCSYQYKRYSYRNDDDDLGTRTRKSFKLPKKKMELHIYNYSLCKLLENPKESKIFFEGVSKLSNLTTICLHADKSFRQCHLFKNTDTIKLFFEDLGKLSQLKCLELSDFNFDKLLEKPEMAEAFFEGLVKPSQLKMLQMTRCDLGELFANPKMAKAFFENLGKLSQLENLRFFSCKLGKRLENLETAKVFFESLSKLSQLTNLIFSHDNFDKPLENPKTIEVFFQSLGKLIRLKHLGFFDCGNLGKLLEKPQMANAFVEALVNLSKLRFIYLGANYIDLSRGFVRRIEEKNQQNALSIKNDTEAEPEIVVEAIQNNTEAECDIIVKPIHDGIETKCMGLLENSHQWTNEIKNVLLKESKTVTDAIFACQLLVYMGPSDDPHRPNQLRIQDVQSNVNAVCLRVLDELANVNSNNPDVLEARNQEIANLSSLVQYCASKGYLTADAPSIFNLNITHIKRSNKVFAAIQELQNNQKTIVQGIQSLGDIVHEHTQRIDDLHRQCHDCFEYVMKRMSNEYSHLQKDLRSTQEHLKRTLDSLHQIGQKRLMAARIKAVSGTGLSAIALIPFVGACIAEGSRAIANAFSITSASNIANGIKSLKKSIADAANGSTIKDQSEKIKMLSLGELLAAHGMPLPGNNETIQDLAAVTLGDLSEKVSSGISAVAEHRISDLDDSATEQNGTAFGEISAAMSNHSFPNNTQTAPAILPTQRRAEVVSQSSRPQAIAPAAAPLQRNDSTGSLATVDDSKYKAAAAIKYHDPSSDRSTARLRKAIQAEVQAELAKPGSTGLTTPTIPTRNSNQLSMTLMDIAVHYGRSKAFEILEDETEGKVDLKSANPDMVIDRAWNKAGNRVGMYNNEAKRVTNN